MDTSLDRRRFLRAATLTGAGLVVPAVAARAVAAADPARSVFRHGVASGDPLPDGVVLWTRVTPVEEARPGSGRGPEVEVGWQVATDPGLTRVVRRGSVPTGPRRDHTVAVDVRGLAPGTTYWYRFHLDGVPGPVGRTRTAPAVGSHPGRLRLGVVSCANWQAGYFAAYRHLAGHDLDAVLHLGDYLYEYGPGEYQARDLVVRPHEPAHETRTLADYRARHGQYRTDPDLQVLHAHHPFVVTWDDHESANDAWREGAENHTEGLEGGWAARRAASRQAYAEWMPVRYTPGGPLYRHLRFGRLAELSLLDLRSYRDRPAGPDELHRVGDPSRTITGDAQGTWLHERLLGRQAQWGLVGNPVMVSPVVFPPLPQRATRPVTDVTGLLPPDGVPYNTDQWDGYTEDRRELVHLLADHDVTDTVFLTGDIHSTWACELPVDPGTYPLSRSVATELVGTSVTSDNLDDLLRAPPRTGSLAVESAVRASNRHVRHLEFDSHGYAVVDVTAERLQMDWYYVTDRTDPEAGARWAAGWATPGGTQRLVRASGPAP